METPQLFQPIQRAVRHLETEIDRLQRRAARAEGSLRARLAERAGDALDEAARLSRELTDAWRAQGAALDRKNRAAAAATRRHLEHVIATLRRRAEALRPSARHEALVHAPPAEPMAPPPSP